MSLIAKHISLPSPASNPTSSSGELRLSEVSCEIKPGQLTVLIGPNGCGKTSLIRCLSGELQPTSGQISLDQLALEHYTPNQLAQRRAVLPQQTQLNFPFRVAEVIALGRSPFKADKQKDQTLVDAAMQTFGISPLAQRWYTQLSGGEKQRVQLARVWLQTQGSIDADNQPKSRYLLLDEPTSALDLRHKKSLMSLLKTSTQSGQPGQLGILAALHNLDSAARYADQLILLNHGKVVAIGSPQSVLTADNIEQVYGITVDFLPYQPSDKEPIAMPIAMPIIKPTA